MSVVTRKNMGVEIPANLLFIINDFTAGVDLFLIMRNFLTDSPEK